MSTPTYIPRILHFSLPPQERVSERTKQYLAKWALLHPTPDWKIMLWQDPIPEEMFPITSFKWPECTCPVQMSGLMRLEAVYIHGGYYIDSDIEPLKCLETLKKPLTTFIIGRQDEPRFYTPDAFFGAEPGHLLLADALYRVIKMDMRVAGPLGTGPENLTAVVEKFKMYKDVQVLPIKAIYPYNYTEKHRANEDFSKDPEVWAIHRWQHSWNGF